jgi:predicted nuclease with RNAse H fold
VWGRGTDVTTHRPVQALFPFRLTAIYDWRPRRDTVTQPGGDNAAVNGSTTTLGIDLAADDAKTAACAIFWAGGRGEVTLLERRLSNGDLRGLIGRSDWSGIDAPFSWPISFRQALSAHGEEGGWPEDYRSLDYQFRATDRFTNAIARRPLSVSTDRIGVTAMRCARLLHEIGEDRGKRIDLAGGDRVIEIYPAAALSAWGAQGAGFDPKGYKMGAHAKAKRAVLVDAFAKATEGWLNFGAGFRAACVANDHMLDAFIAALATRAAQLGKSRLPNTEHHRMMASIEGWIHVPEPGTLSLLSADHLPDGSTTDVPRDAHTAAARSGLTAT